MAATPSARSAPAPACVLAVLLSLVGLAPARAVVADWQATLERAASAVVVLRVAVPRSFDTDRAAYEVATGFVVDAERGLILTNRHVVKPGPSVAEAVFRNHEEVPVRAVYRDPVHDFGFFQYDPADVRFMKTVELRLAPERARVGTEIRVIGNDAGEKLSILQGTLARLDRAAPNYGRDNYNDFNTFYLQAASGTSGGSSGSPVIDLQGNAVGLNAGGSRSAASSFYLPLDRVARALDLLRKGQPVPRGTIQTVFSHQSYDELRRLGLREQTEAQVRAAFPGGTGMLVVAEIVPGGPAVGGLEVGDVLVRVDGKRVTGFVPLEAALDGHVGGTLRLDFERGGAPLSIDVDVQDLHAITPSAYLEIGGAVIHPLSYQRARSHAVPARGLYVAAAGYMFWRGGMGRGAVITALDGEPVADLATLEARLAQKPDGARVAVRYFGLSQPRTDAVKVVRVDRRWFPMQRCVRDDGAGAWTCTPSPEPPPPVPLEPVGTSFPKPSDAAAAALAPSLAMVGFSVPYRVDGIHGRRFTGAGLVVDAERGLVVVDRDTVPAALGDVTVTFAGSVEVPGRVVYLHPAHNLAVVSYDPALLGDTPVRSAELRPRPLSAGDEVWLVGLNDRHRVVSIRTEVTSVEAVALPVTHPPRFRATNVELIGLADQVPTVGGALVDGKGRVLAHWASLVRQTSRGPESFLAGVPATRLAELVERLRADRELLWRDLGAELMMLPLVAARDRGLSAELARRVEEQDGDRRRVLSVVRLTAGTPSAELLRPGDLLLGVDEHLPLDYEDVERAAQSERVRVSALRAGREVALEIPTTVLDGRGTDRVLLWAGAVLQQPHHAIAAERGVTREGVYVSWFWYGSPANRYGLRATRLIVAVDGRPVRGLDEFLAAVRGRPDRSPVRLHTLDLEDRAGVVTLKLDLEFWPTVELRRTPAGWKRESR